MVETMLCYSKLEQLFHRVYPALRNFPVAEKYALSQEIKLGFLRALRCMHLGNSVKSKRKDYLLECEGELLHLTAVMRLCRNQKYISKGFFEDIDLCLTEIKRLLSGWIKQTIGTGRQVT
jgi:hypothetical protein